MKVLAGAIAVLAALVILSPTDADARAGKRKVRSTDASRVVQSPPRERETMEDLRARYADPAGDYKGMPNWARAAFGTGSRGRQ